MSDDDLKAELERLKAENEPLKKGGQRAVSLKVSEKGGLSVYGLGRFPVTLYKEQWAKLLDMADETDDGGSLVARVYSTCMVLRGDDARGR
jgi:hypothetical protein